VLKADFFPFKGGDGSFCQFGDLIVIDEAAGESSVAIRTDG
jgi:zona occludens toxin